MLSVRIPREYHDRIERRASERAVSKSAIVKEALDILEADFRAIEAKARREQHEISYLKGLYDAPFLIPLICNGCNGFVGMQKYGKPEISAYLAGHLVVHCARCAPTSRW